MTTLSSSECIKIQKLIQEFDWGEDQVTHPKYGAGTVESYGDSLEEGITYEVDIKFSNKLFSKAFRDNEILELRIAD